MSRWREGGREGGREEGRKEGRGANSVYTVSDNSCQGGREEKYMQKKVGSKGYFII